MTTPLTDGANALLNQSSAKGLKWDDIGKGVWVTGKVKGHSVQQCTKWDAKENKYTDELDFWADGDPKMQIIVDWATDLRDPEAPEDDGRRTLRSGGYKRSSSIIGAIRDAYTKAGAPGLEHEANLGLMWVDGEGRSGDPRQFTAAYERPVTVIPGSNGNGGPVANPFAKPAPQPVEAF